MSTLQRTSWLVLHGEQVFRATVIEGGPTCSYVDAAEAVRLSLAHRGDTCRLAFGLVVRIAPEEGAWPTGLRTADGKQLIAIAGETFGDPTPTGRYYTMEKATLAPRGSGIVQRAEETLQQVDATLAGCSRPYLGPHLTEKRRVGVAGTGPGLIGNERTFVPVDQATPEDVYGWDALRSPQRVEAMRVERQRRLTRQAAAAQLAAEVQAAVVRFIEAAEAFT